MNNTSEQIFRELIANDQKFIESLFVIENKDRQLVPFKYNTIQDDANKTETGRDIWVKPSQVGFSSERIAKRLKQTLTVPGTNTVLIAYEDFITERLLSKVNFYYNHLSKLCIPGFPIINNDSKYEKTFDFIEDGHVESKSSIYIASARSYVAGRAETIHHLLVDEFAFWTKGALERILVPAMARVPPTGTIDVFSTPNGMENDFYNMYQLAKEGKSVFKPHFYPWWLLKEYAIELGDRRILMYLPQTDSLAFPLTQDEDRLMSRFGLTFSQIRWRRWMILQMESLKRAGETRVLFQQEFPEDDVSCFLATGDMYFDQQSVDRIAKNCYPASQSIDNMQVWYPYDAKSGMKYLVCVDPGQARITQTAIVVWGFKKDEIGNTIPYYCARDAGLYPAELTATKAMNVSRMYGRCMVAWEANAHGLALTELLKRWRPIYYRKDIVSGISTLVPGWLTTSKTKPYMLQAMSKYLADMVCHDIEIPSQLRNHRIHKDDVEVVGANDIFMAAALGLTVYEPANMKRGLVGVSGWKW